MACRLYYVTLAPETALTPAVDAAWEKSTSLVRRLMAVAPGGNTGNGNGIAGNGSNPNDTIREQFITPPLQGDQTIAGTVKGQMMMFEGAAAANAMTQLGIRVMQSDGSIRGTLLALHTQALANELNPTTYRNAKNPTSGLSPASLTSVAALDGDRLVIEPGVRIHSTNVTNASMRYVAAGGGADLPEDETTTTDGYPWLEFSQDLTFYKLPDLRHRRMPPLIAQ